MDRHVHRRRTRLDVPTTEKSILVYSFSKFGLAASFATYYEDTTPVAV
jgi:hypothetical protein